MWSCIEQWVNIGLSLWSLRISPAQLCLVLKSVVCWFADSEEVAQPTKLSQFLKGPSTDQQNTDTDLKAGGREADRSDREAGRNDRIDRDKRQHRQPGERGSDREHVSTQQRLLALAQYTNEPGSDDDDRHKSERHKSSQHSESKQSASHRHRKSPGHHRRH